MEPLSRHDKTFLKKISGRFQGIKGKPLGKELFEFCSSIVPAVNVDVLLVNSEGKYLLTWRDDEFYGPGWHIPGGVVRHKETLQNRVKQVVKTECGYDEFFEFPAYPELVQEIFSEERCIRGHFISLLYTLRTVDVSVSGSLTGPGRQFFSKVPQNLIVQHQQLYTSYLHENFNS